jgi:hypothetical protein
VGPGCLGQLGAGRLLVIGFADGNGAHIRDLARGGIHVYAAWGPVPVQVFLIGSAS